MFHGVYDSGYGAQSRDWDADGGNCVIVNNEWVLRKTMSVVGGFQNALERDVVNV